VDMKWERATYDVVRFQRKGDKAPHCGHPRFTGSSRLASLADKVAIQLARKLTTAEQR
jgi:hypothetical protein